MSDVDELDPRQSVDDEWWPSEVSAILQDLLILDRLETDGGANKLYTERRLLEWADRRTAAVLISLKERPITQWRQAESEEEDGYQKGITAQINLKNRAIDEQLAALNTKQGEGQ